MRSLGTGTSGLVMCALVAIGTGQNATGSIAGSLIDISTPCESSSRGFRSRRPVAPNLLLSSGDHTC
jgi:hypothetical protein